MRPHGNANAISYNFLPSISSAGTQADLISNKSIIDERELDMQSTNFEIPARVKENTIEAVKACIFSFFYLNHD